MGEPNEVKEVVKALEKISLNDLKTRFVPKIFNSARIYPNSQPHGWTTQELKMLLPIYEKLVCLFQKAAKCSNFIFISPG